MPGRSSQLISRRSVRLVSGIERLLASVADCGGCCFGYESVIVEALKRERLDELRRLSAGDELGERLADDRSGLEAVGSPASAEVEVVHLGAAEDRAVVGADVAEPGPGAQQARVFELGEKLECVARE